MHYPNPRIAFPNLGWNNACTAPVAKSVKGFSVCLIASIVLAGGQPVSAHHDGTGSHEIEIIDCGDQTTTVTRAVKKAVPEDEVDPRSLNWVELARQARATWDPSIVIEPEVVAEPEMETIDGCALDHQPEIDAKIQDLIPVRAEVLATRMVADNSNNADGSHENGNSQGQTLYKSNGGSASSKDEVKADPIEWDALDMRWVLAGAAAILLAILALFAHRFAKHFWGFVRGRRVCHVAATLTTEGHEFDGHIVILAKLGCRFIPVDTPTLKALGRVLDEPEYSKFELEIAGLSTPVFLDTIFGNVVAAYFMETFSLRQQNEVLKHSTVEVKFDAWAKPKGDPRRRAQVVKSRLARLSQLREEERRRSRRLNRSTA